MRQPVASPDNIDVHALFGAIRRKLIVVGVLALGVGALTYAALSMIAPQYASQAELTIRAKGTNNPFSGPRGDGGPSQVVASQVDKEAVNTHVRALQSPDLAAEIAKKLKLDQLREFNAALGPNDAMGGLLERIGLGRYDANESERDRVLRAFFDRLVVYSPAESRIITIGFRSSDPKLSADVANMLADDYRLRLANASVVETDAVRKALEPKIAQLTQEVGEAEAAAARFRAQSGLLEGGSQKTPLSQQQLGDLTGELTRASAARSSLQASAQTARDLIKKGNPEVIPQVQRSPLIQSLIQQRVQVERDLRKYSATMKPAHPVMRQLNADLRSVKRQIAVEVANVVASIEKEAYSAVEREASVKRSLDAVKARVAESSDEKIEVGRLEAVAASKRAELARLQAQYEQNRARADSGAVPVEADIVTVARPASVASYPRKGPYSALFAAATFLFGMAWVITSALIKGARTPRAASDALRDEIASVAAGPVPTLDAVPVTKTPSPQPAGEMMVRSAGELSEHLLMLGSSTKGSCRTLVVSSGDGGETAPLVRDIGKAFDAEKANAIFIDWNLCGAGLFVARQVNKPNPGITDLIKGKAGFSDVVRALPGSNVHTIGCGAPLAAREKLDREHLNVVLDALDGVYDQIVLVSDVKSAQNLFMMIDGRVDAGVTVAREVASPIDASANSSCCFLGFDVEGLRVFRFIVHDRKGRSAGSKKRTIAPQIAGAATVRPEGPAVVQ